MVEGLTTSRLWPPTHALTLIALHSPDHLGFNAECALGFVAWFSLLLPLGRLAKISSSQ